MNEQAQEAGAKGMPDVQGLYVPADEPPVSPPETLATMQPNRDYQEGYQQGRALRDAEVEGLRTALVYIRDHLGQVCEVYEVCAHAACASSYAAWAISDRALKEPRREAAPIGWNAMEIGDFEAEKKEVSDG